MDVTLNKLAREASHPKAWVEKGARLGHFTKGIIYGLMGMLALQSALGMGGRVGGGEEAARFVDEQPFGKVLLVLLGVGLSGYAVWRLIVGIKDTEQRGHTGGALVERTAAVISGVTNAALAVAIFQLALGEASSAGGNPRSWVAEVMEQPFGTLAVGITGIVIVGVGLYQFYLAHTKKFLEPLQLGELSRHEQEWVTRLGQVGHGARGVVLPIIGIALVEAASGDDPAEAKGVREALYDIASSSSGQAQLGLVAAGFIAFGAFMMLSAKYRRCAV